MSRPAPKPRRLRALAAAIGVLALAGCGGQERTIPATDGELLLAQLEEVRSAFAADGCETTLPAAIAELERQAQSLPDSVGEEVGSALEDGVARLETLAERDCEVETTTETIETEPTTTAPPVTVPTETVETKTEKEPPPTEPEEPVEEEPEEPVDEEFVPPGQQQGGPPGGGNGGPEGFSGRGGDD